MKTKLPYVVIFLISFLEPVFSQEYHPLLSNSSWIINDAVSCCRPPYIRMINEGVDVAVGEYAYKKFVDPFPKYDLATETYIDSISIREDVPERKVYKLVNGVEALLYDYSMENGDTISQHGFTWSATVDNCNINGNNRKRITLHTTELWNNHTLTQIWIEGVGTNAHPFYPERNMYSVMSSGGGTNYFTKCSFQDGEHIYGNQTECAALYPSLATENTDAKSQKFTFAPNPVVSEFTVYSKTDFLNATLKLYNMQGQLVKEIPEINGSRVTISRNNLNSGLYLAQLFEGGKMIQTTKLLVR